MQINSLALEQYSLILNKLAVKTAPERCGDETRLRGLGRSLVRVGGLCGPQALRRGFNRPLPRCLVFCQSI